METPVNKSSEKNNLHWLDITEILAVISSIGGSIACIWLQKFVYASIPLSASVALNLLNRQRMLEAISKKNQSIITTTLEQSNNNNFNLEDIEAKIQTQYQKNKSRYTDLAGEIEKLQNIATVELIGRVQAGENQLTNISQEIQEIRNSLFQLDTLNQDLDSSFSELTQQQVEIDRVVKEMRVLGNNKQSIVLDENTASSYYERGLVYHQNGYHNKAQENYQKALELEPNLAEVYHHRGLLYQEIGQKRQAVEDLRKASQLYFEQRDLDKYNLTRDLSQKVHQQEDVDPNNLDKSTVNNKVAVNELFSQ